MSAEPPVTDIKDLSAADLTEWLERQGLEPYRAAQILKWVYKQQVDDFMEMTNLSMAIRATLAGRFVVARLEVAARETSCDGSIKTLLRLRDGLQVESVLIPERDHTTLCISCQVGCAQGCRFCLTAAGGLARNLTSGEIIAQVRDAAREVGDTALPLKNIVFMGMGEPLANYRNVRGAIEMLTNQPYGMGFANRRVTLSTAGLVPRLADLGRDTGVNLAVSLNATDDATRSSLMPVNRRWPIQTLLAACRDYPLKPTRRITFEYILMAGVNDTAEDARQLARLLRGQRAKINLIPFNEHADSDFKRPPEAVVQRFRDQLVRRHYTVIVRRSKGQDISAACGQLRVRAESRLG